MDRKSGTMAQHTPPPRGSKARVEPEAEPKEDGEVGETIGDVLMRHGHELTGKLGAMVKELEDNATLFGENTLKMVGPVSRGPDTTA